MFPYSPVHTTAPPLALAVLLINVELSINPSLEPLPKYTAPPSPNHFVLSELLYPMTVLFSKCELSIFVLLADRLTITAPPSSIAVLFTKRELFIVMFSFLRMNTAPPNLLTLLFVKFELRIVPLLPIQFIAPPFPPEIE